MQNTELSTLVPILQKKKGPGIKNWSNSVRIIIKRGLPNRYNSSKGICPCASNLKVPFINASIIVEDSAPNITAYISRNRVIERRLTGLQGKNIIYV